MNVPIPDPHKNEGSSLVLAILIGVAAIVVIALMIQTTGGDGKKDREEVQRDAIAESMDVFNKFDSIMEDSSVEAKRENAVERREPPPREKESNSKQPARPINPPTSMTDPPEGGGTQKWMFFDGFGDERDEVIFAKEVDSSFGALDAVAGLDLSEEEELALNDLATPVLSRSNQRLVPMNAERMVPESLMPEARIPESLAAEELIPTPQLPEVDPRSMSGAEVAVPRLVELAADSDLDVALREAVAVREGFSAAAEVSPVNRLSPPLFSHPSGSFPLKHFDIELNLANPNPKRLSRIRYSIGRGEWLVYEGTPIRVGPGTKVSAYCESMARSWGDSPKESREFTEQTVSLTPPTIYASALEFDERANQTISIAITNPNRYAASRVEYRFGGSPWQIYREMVKFDGAQFADSGVTVEARVVGVIGIAGRQASESVSIEVAPAMGRSESVAAEAAPRRDSIIELRSVDLGAPDQPHGYRAHGPAQFELARITDPEGEERFLLETFEAYRKVREAPEDRSLTAAGGNGDWGRLSILIPDESDPAALSSLAERKPEKSVLEASAISLFDSPVAR